MRFGWICRIIYSISLIFGRLPIIGLWAERLGLHSGLAPKGLNADVKRAECFNGHASPLGFSEWACVFRWTRLFLGPGEWACEPYFSNPISTYLGACGCIEDIGMGSLCLRLFTTVHRCWQSISSCGMIYA